MGLMPPSLAGKIQFVESHLADWQTNAVAIGSSAGEITALTTKTTTARAALTAQETAQETAKTKTAALRDAVDAMALATADLVKKVRAKAATDGNTIYQLANIPAPATPGPRPAPGAITDFAVALDGNGAINLKWKCANPAGCSGTIYQLWRRIGGDAGEFTYIGAAGEKKFVDMTVPAGSSSITYQMQAQRSTSAGPWSQFNVNFGVGGGGGGITPSITESAPTKLAA